MRTTTNLIRVHPHYRSNPIVATRSNAIPSNPLIRIIIIIKWALQVRHN